VSLNVMKADWRRKELEAMRGAVAPDLVSGLKKGSGKGVRVSF
jgi:hypothetical protein